MQIQASQSSQSSSQKSVLNVREAARQIDIKRKHMKINHYCVDVVTVTATAAAAAIT